MRDIRFPVRAPGILFGQADKQFLSPGPLRPAQLRSSSHPYPRLPLFLPPDGTDRPDVVSKLSSRLHHRKGSKVPENTVPETRRDFSGHSSRYSRFPSGFFENLPASLPLFLSLETAGHRRKSIPRRRSATQADAGSFPGQGRWKKKSPSPDVCWL